MALIKLNSRAIPDSTVVNTDIADSSVTQAKIVDGSISSAKIADDAVTGSKIGIETGRRNVFINGNFRIAQRGTSTTYTGGIWQYLSPDRWFGHFDQTPTGATHHVFDGGPTSDANNKFAEVRGPTSANSGNGAGYFGQRVESSSLAGIRAKNSFTISGYIKRSGSVNQAISTNIICPTATDNFAGYTTHGSVFTSATISGDGTVNNNGTLTLTSVDTWYYFTVTRTSATSLTNFDKGLQIYWAFGNCHNTSDKIQFAQLQLEEGTEATTFEHSTYAAELYLCQRYCQKIAPGYCAGNGVGSSAISFGYFLGAPMRTTPTIPNSGHYTHRSGNVNGSTNSIVVNGFSQDSPIIGLRDNGHSVTDEVAYNVYVVGSPLLVAEL
jgi:hypothetical protein